MLDENASTNAEETPESGETPDQAPQKNPSKTPEAAPEASAEDETAPVVTVTTTTRRKGAGRPAGPPALDLFSAPMTDPLAEPEAEETAEKSAPPAASISSVPGLMFQAPPEDFAPPRPKPAPATAASDDDKPEKPTSQQKAQSQQKGQSQHKGQEPAGTTDSDDDSDSEDGEPKRRRRSRGGRRRRKSDGHDDSDDSSDSGDGSDSDSDDSDSDDGNEDGNGSSRRRRRRSRAGEGAETASDDPENTVVKVREGRAAEDEITGVSGSTRLEAKKQRRREGREAGRRRAPIVSEAEFLARRESVDRQMIVRQREDYTQIAVLEDKVLVEHYVARESQTSLIGNVYLGKVQNVLPSMEAAFVDIGAGRNAVIYAGEVDWSNVQNGKQRKIEDALAPGQTILVQATKDPIGQKGARLTSQISLPGRFLVYVPGGGSNGISRKLPETERTRLKGLLKEALPESAGVIVRTAAEGATEDQLTRDVSALTARWEDIESKSADGKSPQRLYAEPDLMIKVIRDLFNEDFTTLTVQGADAWEMVSGYLSHVAPDLAERISRWEGDQDVFAEHRIDEQINKALEPKVHLPSGGSLVIDRTEAMIVVDVNTGRFTGTGGNLEETVTKNNLEAAEEIVRQMRLRDLGGIIVIDFIDMVLENNRDLVLRRLVECLGRDRTRHQVAEVTSLGLVQMTRKRIGTGLLESFSHDCETCRGAGVIVADGPVEPKSDDGPRRGRRGGQGGQGQGGGSGKQGNQGRGGKSKNKQDGGDKDTSESNAPEEPKKDGDSGPSDESAKSQPARGQKSKGGKSSAKSKKEEAPEAEAPVHEAPAEPKSDSKSEPKSEHQAEPSKDAPGKSGKKPSGDDSGGPVLTDQGPQS